MWTRVPGTLPVPRCDSNDIVEGSFNVLSIRQHLRVLFHEVGAHTIVKVDKFNVSPREWICLVGQRRLKASLSGLWVIL